MKEVNVDELRRRLETGEDLVVLDVREPDEVARTAIPGSVNIPLGEVADRMGELDASRPPLQSSALAECAPPRRSGP